MSIAPISDDKLCLVYCGDEACTCGEKDKTLEQVVAELRAIPADWDANAWELLRELREDE